MKYEYIYIFFYYVKKYKTVSLYIIESMMGDLHHAHLQQTWIFKYINLKVITVI